MPRQPRIDSPGLLQHVIVRGVARSDIFIEDEDRHDFVRRLEALLSETETRCFAWALLDNHFHLLLMPTSETLSRFMRRLLTGYAVSFNLRHQRSGHLFQNRYKSIVCDSDAYLLELIRYIHLNPVRAGIVTSLEELAIYPWSGHRQLLKMGTRKLICAEAVLALFSNTDRTAREKYHQFLADGLEQKHLKLSSGGRHLSRKLNPTLGEEELFDERILGSGLFVEKVLGQAQQFQSETKLSLDTIIERIAACFDLEKTALTRPCREAEIVRAKALICYLAVRCNSIAGVDVAKRLNYSTSAVSQAAKRGERLLNEDEVLQQMVKELDL